MSRSILFGSQSRKLAAGVAFFLLCGPAPAARADEILKCPGSSMPWEGEGFFVRFPAAFAASPAGLVGAGLALAFAPADLVASGWRHAPQDETIPRFAHVGLCAGVYLAEGLAYAGGAPFWAIKKAFWDGPRRLIEGPRPPPPASRGSTR